MQRTCHTGQQGRHKREGQGRDGGGRGGSEEALEVSACLGNEEAEG
jgi:hypothetical protein